MREPHRTGELADRDGSFLAFSEREAAAGDTRRPLTERYGNEADYRAEVRRVTDELRARRLLLAEDAERFLARD